MLFESLPDRLFFLALSDIVSEGFVASQVGSVGMGLRIRTASSIHYLVAIRGTGVSRFFPSYTYVYTAHQD